MNAARHFVTQCFAIVVIALTNVGFALTIVGVGWTTLGCAPGAIHVAPADSTAFQHMIDIDVLSDARRPAHLMRQIVSGRASDKAREMDNDKLPEAYNRDGYDSVWPSQHHLAYAARRLLREFYAATQPTYQVLEEEDDELVEVVDKAGGNLGLVLPFEKARPLDIADIQSRRLFEIVPPGEGERSWGNNKVEWILKVVNMTMLGVPPFELGTNYEGEVGVRFAEDAPAWSLTWKTVDPGVIQYHWHVLSAEDASEKAHGKAYLDNRWHDPTPFEMVRFARALHEAVERLVQAREALGQKRAAETMPILPGTTSFDYMRSLVWWSAHDDKVARLLPVMRKPPVVELRKTSVVAQASPRRNAHIIGQTVGGGGGVIVTGGPEGYDVKGRPGNQPWHLHMGNAAHKIIGEHYKLMYRGNQVFINTVSIATIVSKAGGFPGLVRADEALLKPDITDVFAKVVFQIKSSAAGQLQEGQVKVAQDITALNRAMAPNAQFMPGTGFNGEAWVRFRPGITSEPWRLKWDTTAPGVIQYWWTKPAATDSTEESINKAIAEGRWVNLTEAEMKTYAKKLDDFVDAWVSVAVVLGQIQKVTTVVVTGIAMGTMLYISPGLGLGVGRGIRPVASNQPPRIQVGTPPLKSGITPRSVPVNARPLGTDKTAPQTGSGRGTQRPAVPRKTTSESTNTSPQ